MSHLYPLAATAVDALKGAEFAALTRSDAARLAGDETISGLETEWLTLPQDEAEAALSASETGAGAGFVQRYENADGAVVLAVTYWKFANADTSAKTEPARLPAEDMPATSQDTVPEEDHTDDLYFRAGRTKKRGRAKKTDPNQIDLFEER